MERGYLVAVLAIIATFTGLSRGISSFEHSALIHLQRFGALSRAECPTNSAARAIAKLKTHLRPHTPEEAQLLAEMNVPSAVTDEMSAQEDAAASARCARARAMQEAERAQRNMLRMQRDMQRSAQEMRFDPIAVRVQLPPDFEQRIQESTAAAARIATHHVQLQIDRLNCTSKTSASEE